MANPLRVLIVLCIGVIAVAPAHSQWAHMLQNEQDVNGWRLGLDHQGDLYAAGLFRERLSVEPLNGPDSLLVSSTDGPGKTLYLLKYDAAGHRVFAMKAAEYHGAYSDGARISRVGDLATDREGNVVLVGMLSKGRVGGVNSMQFGSDDAEETVVLQGQCAMFVAAFSPTARLRWARLLGDLDTCTWHGLAVRLGIDHHNNVYVSGIPFVTKISSDGDVVWSIALSTASGGVIGPRDIAVDEDQVCLASYAHGPVDVDPGQGIFELADSSFLVCYSFEGTFRHAVGINVLPTSIAFGGPLNDLHIAASVLTDTVRFEGGPQQAIEGQGSDAPPGAVVVVDAALRVIRWAHAIPLVTGFEGCNRGCGGARLAVTERGDVVVSGGMNEVWPFTTSSGPLRFRPNNLVTGFVMHFDARGQLQGGFQLGEGGQLAFNDVAVDEQGAVYLTGFFSWLVDFDPSPEREAARFSRSYHNAFVMRTDLRGSLPISVGIEERGAVPATSDVDLGVYPNPTSGPLRILFQGRPSSHVEIELVDVLGRTVRTLHQGVWMDRSILHVNLQNAHLMTGLYFLRVRGDDFALTRAVTFIR